MLRVRENPPSFCVKNVKRLEIFREQIIVFAYDSEYCQHESDDPQKAVLYFHPNWVNEHQRLALCGQLMGATQFCSTLFSPPSVLTLQSGKFLLKKYGRFIISVGSDQSLQDWILKERFRALQTLIEFYHKDLYQISESVGYDHENFMKRLSQIFDAYIPVLQAVVTSVGSVPSLQYTNNNSSVFLEALQLLESCTAKNEVPGGLILHNGRVVVSQLNANVNLLACLTDPYRVKSCGQTISVPFHLPVGVQLLRIFVKSSVLTSLRGKSARNVEVFRRKKATNDACIKKETRIFTLLEEEESQTRNPDIFPKESAYMKLKQRRMSKQKNDALKERSKSYRANPNISVVSTPTVEKKFIHEDVLSICSSKVDLKLPPVPDLVQDVLKSKPTPQYKSLRRISMDDQMIDLTKKSFPVPLKYYSFGLPRMTATIEPKPLTRKKIYKTIADPLYPVFREDGLAVTKVFYNQCLDEHYKDYLMANKTIDSQEAYIKTKQMEMKKKEPSEEPVKVNEKKIDQKVFRRSLTLPVKPMNLNGDDPPVTKAKILHGTTPTTPLMAKLSLLALEEMNEVKPVELPQPSCVRKKEEKEERKVWDRRSNQDIDEDENSPSVPCTLFVLGQGHMTMFLILEENAEQKPELLLFLWELATSNLERIESAWNRSMDHMTQNGTSSSYSFLSLDPNWGTVRKYGAWGNDELRLVGSLHQDMLETSNITEMIFRNEESVVYGYRCGGTETYYQQSGSPSIGLPTPADLMGVITLKARRRLERDHGVILL